MCDWVVTRIFEALLSDCSHTPAELGGAPIRRMPKRKSGGGQDAAKQAKPKLQPWIMDECPYIPKAVQWSLGFIERQSEPSLKGNAGKVCV